MGLRLPSTLHDAPYTSPISPLHLPYISPISPLHLPYISQVLVGNFMVVNLFVAILVGNL